jgi:hypothetical protein
MPKPLPQSVSNAIHAFLIMVEGVVPTPEELESWLVELDINPAQREELRVLGPLTNWTEKTHYWSFREYITARRSTRIVDYMAEHLNSDDFTVWVDFVGLGGDKLLRILSMRF